MAIQIVPTGGAVAAADSLVIPQTDLAAYGLTAAEMTADATGEARSVFAFLKGMQDADLTGILGLSKPALPSKSIAAAIYTNRTYSMTMQKLVDSTADTFDVVPVPSGGANSGVGAISVVDVFPNASKVASAGNIANPSLAFDFADLAALESGVSYAGTTVSAGQDHRLLLMAIYKYLATGLSVRDASTASAYIALSKSAFSISGIPATWYSATDPLSDISASDIADQNLALLSQTTTITLQTTEDESTDTFDVRVVTA